MSENETKEPTAEAVEETQPTVTEEVKAEATETTEAAAEIPAEKAIETVTAEAAAESTPEAATETGVTEAPVEEAKAEATPETAAEAPAEEPKAEASPETPAEPEVPAEPEEISYHAVEKDDEITAIWEMQGRKHIRTIIARSSEGQKILSLFTSEIHETDSPAMSSKAAETTEEATA